MPQKLTALTSSGKEKTIYWDKTEDPTQDDIDNLPDYVESKPSISSRFIKGITDPATSLYEGVRSTGVNAAKHLKEGNYPAAFHDVAAPIIAPFEGIENYLSSGRKSIPNPSTQLGEQAGIPVSLMKDSYAKGDYARLFGQGASSLALLALSAKGMLPEGSKSIEVPKINLKEMPLVEHGPYPLRDTSTPIGPMEQTSFEGLTPRPENPKVDWNEPRQQGLDIQFDDPATQPNLNLQDYPSLDNKNNKLFNITANTQRGAPESAMLEVQNAAGGGLLGQLAEHVGDLTHRMTENNTSDTRGYSYVKEKVDKTLRWLNSSYGIEKEIGENSYNNAMFRKLSPEEHQSNIDNALAKYAFEHEKIPVHNEVQELAKQAAIDIGNKNFDGARTNLTKLKNYLDEGKDAWVNKASEIKQNPEVIGPKQPEVTPQPLQPRIAGLDRPTWSKFAEQRNLPLDYDTLQTMETSPIPEVQKAAQQVVESTASVNGKTEGGVTFSRTEGYQNPSNLTSAWGKVTASGTKKVADDFFKSNYSVLVSDSPVGKAIAGMIDKFRAEVGKTSGEISAKIKDVVSPLNKDQYTQFQQLVDAGGNSTDPMVQNAIDVVRNIDQQFTARATASGLHLKTSTGELVPFTGKDNYWPRMYPPEMFKDKPALIERLIKGGMAPDAAFNAVNNARKFGERLIDPQNARVLDLPDHRKDLGALLKHYDDMAHRIGSAETFGVKDIADPDTPISQLTAQAKDPIRVTKILRQYLDREGGVSPHEADFVKNVSKVTTAFYLSKFALSNSNQLAFVPIVTNFKSTGKAISQFVRSPKKTWREAEATGALQTVMQEAMRDAGGESIVSKAFLIKASEGSNRTISAIAGKYYLKDLFTKAKKGNVRAIKSLEDLTLDTWDNMKVQDTLNDKQVAYGATRVVEKTQGRAQSIDLPYNWDRSPYTNLLLLYKKYAFVQGRLVKDAIKSNPARNIPLLLALFQSAGEVTGDAKAVLGSMITGDPTKAVEDRGKYIGTSHPAVNRVIQNYVDSMFLGLIGDALQATRSGKAAMYQTAVGPVISLPIETGGNAVADMKSKNLTIKKSQTLRGLASHVPFIGSSINRYMKQP